MTKVKKVSLPGIGATRSNPVTNRKAPEAVAVELPDWLADHLPDKIKYDLRVRVAQHLIDLAHEKMGERTVDALLQWIYGQAADLQQDVFVRSVEAIAFVIGNLDGERTADMKRLLEQFANPIQRHTEARRFLFEQALIEQWALFDPELMSAVGITPAFVDEHEMRAMGI